MHWSILFYIVWVGIPVLSLILFGLLRPKLVPLTLLICPIVDFLVYHQEFFYYESQGLILLFTAIQLILTAIPVFIIWFRARK